jgi:flagellar capping protein FliD
MDGVTAILNRTGSTQITYTADFSRAVDDVQNFLDAFNNMRDAASGTPLDRQLTGAVNRNVWSLGSSGIGFDSNGNLSINDVNMLTEAISNGGFARNFQGISNFGSNLYDVTLTAHSTVYGAALQDSFSELMSSLSRSTTYGNWQNSASFMLSPGLIFSTWG